MNHELTTNEELNLLAEELKNLFTDAELDLIARKCSFVQRQSPLTARDFIYLCVYADKNVAIDTLVNLCSNLDANTNTLITPQALHERFNEFAVKFLKVIWNYIIKGNLIKSYYLPTKYDKYISRIRILDSTAYQIPDEFADKYIGAGGCSHTAGIKCQVEFDLLSGEFLNVDVGEGRSGDSKYGEYILDTIESGDLILRDLGYFKIENFNVINEKNAYYISRLKTNTTVYIKNPNPEYYKNGKIKKSTLYQKLDITKMKQHLKEGETLDILEVFIGKEKIASRLIVHKLTKEQEEKRLQDLNKKEKKKGIEFSDKTYALAEINIYITNITSSILTKEQVHNIYSLRWQIGAPVKAL